MSLIKITRAANLRQGGPTIHPRQEDLTAENAEIAEVIEKETEKTPRALRSPRLDRMMYLSLRWPGDNRSVDHY